MNRQSAHRYRKLDQKGLVSFLVTMIMMLVITLIVTGFTQLVMKSREDALDKQLNAQAFYAAEAGIADTIKALKALYAANVNTPNYTPPPKTDCNTASPYDSSAGKTLASGVSYSCVLVTPNARWVNTSASISGSKVIPVEAVDNGGVPRPIWSIRFEWKPTADGVKSDCLPKNSAYPADWGNCPYGLLRADLYKQGAIAAVNPADGLNDSTYSFYFMPTSDNGGVWSDADLSNPANLLAAGNVRVFKTPASCTNSSCVATITLAEPVGTVSKYYLRLSSIYLDIPRVQVTGKLNDAWVIPQFAFKGQTRIDVTGKAQDVLRRVQAQVSLQDFGGYLAPNTTAHSSGSVCKRFIVAPNFYEDQCTEETAN